LRLVIAIVSLLFLQVILSISPGLCANTEGNPDVYVGVDMSYGDSVTEAKRLIDEVSPYTNLFVLGCKGITYNTTRLNEACQYIVDKGLDFIVYRDTSLRNASWTEMANQKWGKHFLGYYAFDELGGWQIDMHEWRMVLNANNYTDAANSFVNMSSWYLNRFSRFRNTTQFNLYTSDYALYWFDYAAGYDTVFTEFCWNYNRQLNIALCRGAANAHGKDWGVIITWTYDKPPYLESGEKMYEDLVLAYNNGAKYILVFDGNEGWTSSVLKQEHFDALKRFWSYIKENPRQIKPASDRIAYVLPKDYGYGFRGPNDRIWGFWGADNLTNKVCSDINNLLAIYDEKLDIIYDKGLTLGSTAGYSKLFFWNQSIPSGASEPDSPVSSPSPSVTKNGKENTSTNENKEALADYTVLLAIGVIFTAIATPLFLLRKQKYHVEIDSTGIGSDYTGTVVTIDGKNYDKFGASFWWESGSHHTYEFKTRIRANKSANYTKQYILISATGKLKEELVVSGSTTITGNYKPLFAKTLEQKDC
jgi:hypothetical protein